MGFSLRGPELEQQLIEAGNKLLNAPSSIDELLKLLDRVESLLLKVEQAPLRSMQGALLPSMKALILPEILKNSNTDVNLLVASCMIELMRITAPDAPYQDEIMKNIFRLTVAAFERLSDMSSRSYAKAVSVLDTFAKVKSCAVMLDLECDDLIAEIFQLFFRAARYKQSHAVFLDMETIMTSVIDESEDITWDLLSPLLDSVKKEDQDLSSTACKLGKRVLTRSASKLKPYLAKAVQSMDIELDKYAPIVAAICPNGLDHHEKPCDWNSDDRSNIQSENGSTKRGRKLNSLINSAEGYDPWMYSGRKTPKKSHIGMPENQSADHVVNGSPVSSKSKNGQIDDRPRFSPKINKNKSASSPFSNDGVHPMPKKKGKLLNQDDNPQPISVSKEVTLREQVGEKVPELDIELRNEKVGKKDLKIKKEKCPTKVNSAATEIKKGTTQAPGDLILDLNDCAHSENDSGKKKGADWSFFLGDSEKITLHSENDSGKKNGDGGSFFQMGFEEKTPRSASESGKKKGNDRSFPQTGSKKKSLVHETTDKKKTNPQGSDGKETPKTKPKRKRSVDKGEEVSGTPRLGREIVGKRIKVWWPLDKKFYEGVVDSYDDIKRKHKVVYADGDEEILNLERQKWKLVYDDNVSSNTWGEKKGKTSSAGDKSSSKKRKNTKSGGGINLENQVLVIEDSSKTDCSKLDSEISVGAETRETGLDSDQIQTTGNADECLDNGNMLRII